MTYDQLIYNISLNKNLSICNKEYSLEHFGNFIIEFEYKKSLLIQILNDRGVIEVSIVASSHFSHCIIPLKYAVNYMQEVKQGNKTYVFFQIADAYNFFSESINILNEIIKNNMLRIILKHWKIDSR